MEPLPSTSSILPSQTPLQTMPLVKCVNASGFPVETAQPLPDAYFSISTDTSTRTTAIIIGSAVGGVVLLLVVILVLIVVLIRRFPRAAAERVTPTPDQLEGGCASCVTPGERDKFQTSSQPLAEGSTAIPPSPSSTYSHLVSTLAEPSLPDSDVLPPPPPLHDQRMSSPPPYRSRQGSGTLQEAAIFNPAYTLRQDRPSLMLHIPSSTIPVPPASLASGHKPGAERQDDPRSLPRPPPPRAMPPEDNNASEGMVGSPRLAANM